MSLLSGTFSIQGCGRVLHRRFITRAMRSGRKAYEEVCKALPALTRARFAKTILWSAHGGLPSPQYSPSGCPQDCGLSQNGALITPGGKSELRRRLQPAGAIGGEPVSQSRSRAALGKLHGPAAHLAVEKGVMPRYAQK